MKILSIIGTRPQIIKLYSIYSECKRQHIEHMTVNTGQHYNKEMDDNFWQELNLPQPKYNLKVGRKHIINQIPGIIKELRPLLNKENPDFALVYGDTNSTLGAALAVKKTPVPLVHIEAGMRSLDNRMPEENARIIVDHLSDILFAPTKTALDNLKREQLQGFWVGDIALESLTYFTEKINGLSLKGLNLKPREYYLITIHRNFNTDDLNRLTEIVRAIEEIQTTIVFPMHPRTQKALKKIGLLSDLKKCSHIKIIKPTGFIETLTLEKNALKIITDSGGVQKEAFFFSVPCVTLRDNTEWTETLKTGYNTLTPINRKDIIKSILEKQKLPIMTMELIAHYFPLNPANKILSKLEERYDQSC